MFLAPSLLIETLPQQLVPSRGPAFRVRTRRLWLSTFLMLAAVLAPPWPSTRDITAAAGAALAGHYAVKTVVEPGMTGLIVLGGGDYRLIEAGRLAEANPDLKVLVSGAGAREDVIARMGSPRGSHRILVDESSLTTFQNAIYARRMLAPQSGDRWLLVTSDYHMPRAVAAFHAVRLAIEPWPVRSGYIVSPGHVLHELAGLAGYRLTGRGSAFWPTRCVASENAVPAELKQRICRILTG